MEQAVKQRLVGAAVLAAVAIITLPLIFDTERESAVQVPERIPPRPDMPAVTMPAPQPVPAPADRPPGEPVPVDQMYGMADDQPADTSDIPLGGVADDSLVAIAPGAAQVPTATAPEPAEPVTAPAAPVVPPPPPEQPAVAKPAPPPAPLPPAPVTKLDASGMPQGWVVQVAAMSDRKKADTLVAKLKLNGHAAFTHVSRDAKGETIRVFVGPKADKAQAVRTKQQIDSEFGLQTMVKQFKP